MAAPHVGDVGCVITILVRDEDGSAVDLSVTTAKTWTVQKPSGAQVTWTPSFVTDGTDGYLKYTTAANDLDQEGVWRVQVNLTFVSSSAKCDAVAFSVKENI
jgi:hypothetical protein